MSDPLTKELFDILACPVCKSSLKYTADKKGLECKQCKAKYPIENGIPVILPPKKK
ncbi:MAG: Trm112 family protein [Nanoarchaeota archaeon]|nr:Trm112 family protein [Nanoarchaeota archaeon]